MCAVCASVSVFVSVLLLMYFFLIDFLSPQERKKLTTRTPMTKERFLKWKEDRKKRQKETEAEEERLRKEAAKVYYRHICL